MIKDESSGPVLCSEEMEDLETIVQFAKTAAIDVMLKRKKMHLHTEHSPARQENLVLFDGNHHKTPFHNLLKILVRNY